MRAIEQPHGQLNADHRAQAWFDAIFILFGILGIAAILEYFGICTQLSEFIYAHRNEGADSLAIASVLMTGAVAIFAARRWGEARHSELLAAHLAMHDTLTGLFNRRGLMSEFQKIKEATLPEAYSILLMDLDNFKAVNDLRGHTIGDEALKLFADTARKITNGAGTLARVGGDEFALVWPGSESRVSDVTIAQALIKAVKQIDRIAGEPVEFGLSVGIARKDGALGLPVELWRQADLALHQAKKTGNTAVTFDWAIDQTLRRRTSMIRALQSAIVKGCIKPHYQPIIDMQQERVYALEVLARWTDDRLGFVPPDVFIPLAAEQGLIDDLSLSLADMVFADAAKWDANLKIAFNVSPDSLRNKEFVELLAAVAEKHDFSLHRLIAEVTEDSVIAQDSEAAVALSELQGRGVELALDDFGTGYACLQPLQRFHFDQLKLDRSFISQLDIDPASRRLVEGVVQLTHTMGVPIVCEGVETVEQAVALRALGCEFAQGWLYSKAVPAADVPAMIAQLEHGEASAAVRVA